MVYTAIREGMEHYMFRIVYYMLHLSTVAELFIHAATSCNLLSINT